MKTKHQHSIGWKNMNVKSSSNDTGNAVNLNLWGT